MQKIKGNCPCADDFDHTAPLDISQKLQFLKHREGLTVQKIADYSGVPVGTINKLLRGDTKDPTLSTIEKLARTFDVPIRYFSDTYRADGLQYDIGLFAAEEQLISISHQEYALLQQFRAATAHQRQILCCMAELFLQVGEELDRGVVTLPYSVTGAAQDDRHQTGLQLDQLKIRHIQVEASDIARQADFVVRMYGSAMEPVWYDGYLLAVQAGQVSSGEVGVFNLNGRGYIRRLHRDRHGLRLATVNRHAQNVCILPQDKLRHLGRVLGPVVPADQLVR